MDCPCGRVKCTCRESKCQRTEGCLCFSCSEWINKKCGLCGSQLPAIYFSEANSIVEKETDICQCFMTDDHGINFSIPVKAQASAECEDVNTVIPRSNSRILDSSLMSTGRPERLTETKKDQNNESSRIITHTITLSHPHQEHNETGSIYTYARFPTPPRYQNKRYGATRMRNTNYIQPHMYSYTYIIPIMSSSTRTSDGVQDYTLDLPEGTTDERRRRDMSERGIVPFYSPEENLRRVFPQYDQIPRPQAFPHVNPFQNIPVRVPRAIPYRHRMRHWRRRSYGNLPPLPERSTSSRERVAIWLRENFSHEHSPDSSESSETKELFAELPFADNESEYSEASTASTSLLKYLKNGTWSSSGSAFF